VWGVADGSIPSSGESVPSPDPVGRDKVFSRSASTIRHDPRPRQSLSLPAEGGAARRRMTAPTRPDWPAFAAKLAGVTEGFFSMKSAQPLDSGGSRVRGRRGPVEPKVTKLFNTKIVTPRPPSTDPSVIERERLVAALLGAVDRMSVTRVTEALFAAGHSVPETQEAHLQILEHTDEARVRASLSVLDAILAREPAKRRPVLEQRLKRLEESAEDLSTRQAATALRRKL
jgi:hypothetical protein